MCVWCTVRACRCAPVSACAVLHYCARMDVTVDAGVMLEMQTIVSVEWKQELTTKGAAEVRKRKNSFSLFSLLPLPLPLPLPLLFVPFHFYNLNVSLIVYAVSTILATLTSPPYPPRPGINKWSTGGKTRGGSGKGRWLLLRCITYDCQGHSFPMRSASGRLLSRLGLC